jgi:hypothetical protein
MENKKLLIGAGVVIVGYLLWKKSQSKVNTTQYSKECLDGLERALQLEYVKPANFEKDFLERCQKITNEANLQVKNKSNNLGATPMPKVTSDPDMEFLVQVMKLPDTFTIKSKNFNTTYYKDKRFGTVFKQNSSGAGFSGVEPQQITNKQFVDAYNEFKKPISSNFDERNLIF